MKLTYFFLISCMLCLLGCQEDRDEAITVDCPNSHIEFFGFALIDVFWDDPLDAPSTKMNYLDEVADFSNIADILVISPTDFIVERLKKMEEAEVKAYLHLNELMFELVDTLAQSGANYDLRADYEARWNSFMETNDLANQSDKIQAFYLGEEAFWNGISYEELKVAANLIKTSLPEIPIMMIEAYPVLSQIQVPESIDWVGFDHYFIKDPSSDPTFQSELAILKSKLSTEEQRIVLVMDTHYIDWIHGDIVGLSPEDMKTVATNYYQLALSEEKTIAIIGYFWPGGFDDPNSLGARQLPIAVKNEYQRIGKLITGKK